MVLYSTAAPRTPFCSFLTKEAEMVGIKEPYYETWAKKAECPHSLANLQLEGPQVVGSVAVPWP